MKDSLKPPFSYGSLSAEDSEYLQERANNIRGLVRQTAENIITIGQSLIEVKERLGHGQFRPWLKTEFEWSISAASQFMNVARRFQHSDIADMNIAASALGILAAPSLPDSARVEALELAASGEKITRGLAIEIKDKHLPSSPKGGAGKKKPLGKRQRLLEQQNSGRFTEIPHVAASMDSSVQVKSGEYWGLGPHILFSGAISSKKFLEIAPSDSPLVLIYPPTPADCPTNLNNLSATYIIYLAQQELDTNFAVLRDWTVNSIELATREGEPVVLSFLPDPGLLKCIDEMDCVGFIADPDLDRCKNAISFWSGIGGNTEKLTTSRLRQRFKP